MVHPELVCSPVEWNSIPGASERGKERYGQLPQAKHLVVALQGRYSELSFFGLVASQHFSCRFVNRSSSGVL